MENKIWKDVEGFNGKVQVSSKGIVRRFLPDGTEDVLMPKPDSHGYYRVYICMPGKSGLFSVHRLVAAAFIPNPDNKPEVNHKDADKANAEFTNLEWVTQEENIAHAIENRLYQKGQDNRIGKMTEVKARKIISLYKSGLRQSFIAKELGIKRNIVFSVVTGHSWQHIPNLSLQPA